MSSFSASTTETPRITVVSLAAQDVEQLCSMLQLRGVTTTLPADIESIRRDLESEIGLSGVIFWYGAVNLTVDVATKQLLESIFEWAPIRFVPTVVVGHHASSFGDLLSARLEFFDTIDSALDPEIVTETILSLGEVRTRELPARRERLVSDVARFAAGDSEALGSAVRLFERRPAEDGEIDDLFGRVIGGSVTAGSADGDRVFAALSARYPDVVRAVSRDVESASPERVLSGAKTALVAALLLEDLLDTKTSSFAALAAFRHVLMSRDSEPDRGISNLFDSHESSGDRLYESAIRLAGEFGALKEAAVLARASQLVKCTAAADDSTLSLAASAVIAGELAARCCWNRHFDQKGAYRIVRRLGTSSNSFLDRRIADRLVKFLTEAAVALPPGYILPAELSSAWKSRRDSGAIEGAQTLGSRIEIERLAPGMTLAAPLLTSDGKQLLESETVLDDDLIRRLWRLCMVRCIEAADIATPNKH